MKKIINKISLIIIVAIIISSLNVVHAAKNNIQLNLEPDANNKNVVVISLVIDDLDEDKLSSISGNIEYDTEVFEELTIEEGNNRILEAQKVSSFWSIPELIDKTTGQLEIPVNLLAEPNVNDKEIMEIKLKIKDTAELGNTTITMKNLKMAGSPEITIGTLSKTISLSSFLSGTQTPQGVPNKNGGTDYGSVEDLYEENGKLEYSQEDKTPEKPQPEKPDDGKPDPGKPDTIKPLKTGDIVLIVAGSIIAIVIIANIVQIIISKRKKQNK